MPLAYEIAKLYGVAYMVGRDASCGIGLTHDSIDSDIIECVLDVANGDPHNVNVDSSTLTEHIEQDIIRRFHDGCYDR